MIGNEELPIAYNFNSLLDNIDWIYCSNSTQSYPAHTHAKHVTIGYILDGEVRIICNGQECVYRAGGYYYILPDIPHAVETVNGTTYSMMTMCIPADEMLDESETEMTCLKKLKQFILEAPENAFLIEDMAQRIGISPYYMIRQFKNACGLTPHQFQIQCRVRKAQKLLEEGKSVTEVAYATGFCDQSHFDRCFRKIVGLTPKEYKRSVRLLS